MTLDLNSMPLPVLPDALRSDWRVMNRGKHSRGLLKRFNERKLGMFVHWGLYSVAAGSWKGQPAPGISEWIMWFADIPREEYAALGEQFNPQRFDAAAWVSLARRAGMKYIVVTAKHHDGFALWDSAVSDFTISKATPSPLQPLDALHEECRRQGLGFGLYYSHVIDWRDGWEGEGGTVPDKMQTGDAIKSNPMNTWDPAHVCRRDYFESKAYPQLEELLARYPDLHTIWFDYWYGGKYLNPPEAYRFYKLVHDWQPDCLVNSRVDGHESAADTLGDYITSGDNTILQPGDDGPVCWETPGTLNNTWGYSNLDADWKGETELIYWISSILSRGGNYLLNIGPTPDGAIPEGTRTAFEQIGRWVDVNGEAVYGTSAWEVDREGEGGNTAKFDGTEDRKARGFEPNFSARDLWFTCKGKTVYAIGLVWPEDNTILVRSLAGRAVTSLSLLGGGPAPDWEQTAEGLALTLPKTTRSTIGFVLRIELA